MVYLATKVSSAFLFWFRTIRPVLIYVEQFAIRAIEIYSESVTTVARRYRTRYADRKEAERIINRKQKKERKKNRREIRGGGGRNGQ